MKPKKNNHESYVLYSPLPCLEFPTPKRLKSYIKCKTRNSTLHMPCEMDIIFDLLSTSDKEFVSLRASKRIKIAPLEPVQWIGPYPLTHINPYQFISGLPS